MTHFSDLTPYSYGPENCPEPHARNIGWLTAGVEFPRASPLDPLFVERLWRFCKVSIHQYRGLHGCELCCSREANVARRNGDELLLGSAEIRVVADEGQVYAAPNLIFHYVASHDYSPPPEFVEAVLMAPCPPEKSYYERLTKLGLSWSDTSVPEQGGKWVRFVKTSEGVVRIEEE